MSLARPIEHPKQVIVEGNDEDRILGALCRHVNLRDVQIQPMGGANSLRAFLRTLAAGLEFERVRSLGVVVDADENRDARRDQVRGALLDAGLPAPVEPLSLASHDQLSVAYLIVPHGYPGTMMEDVCLESVSMDPAIRCVEDYFECISKANVPGPSANWEPKARAHAFLASRERPDLRLGEAAQRGVWDFDSDAFSPLKALLGML